MYINQWRFSIIEKKAYFKCVLVCVYLVCVFPECKLIIVSLYAFTLWRASQLILVHCHPLCICALNIFAIAWRSFTFRYSLCHRPPAVQHSQCTHGTPSPSLPTPVSSWVLTRTAPLILVTANTLLNDQLLSQGPRPQGPTDFKGHPSVFQYWLSGPVNMALGLTESEHCR